MRREAVLERLEEITSFQSFDEVLRRRRVPQSTRQSPRLPHRHSALRLPSSGASGSVVISAKTGVVATTDESF